MNQVSDRLAALAPSQTLAMSQKSSELKAQGVDVINLSVGEPDFNTPQHIKDAAKKAIDDNFSHYSPVPGYMDLRQAICAKLKNENGLDFTPEQIVVSNGAKQSICNTILALVNPGDEVILPAPYWVSYVEMVKLAEGKNVIIETGIEQDFKMTPAQLEAAITPKTKLLILCSPSNEIYEHINYVGAHQSLAQFPSIRERIVIINGVSKGYAMTGWRIGFIAAPLWIAKACNKLQGQYTSGASSIAQKAAAAAFAGEQGCVETMRQAFQHRRDLVVRLAKEIPGLKVNDPQGAFYLFPEISHYLGKSDGERKINTSSDLAMYILEVGHVATVAGDAFGAPDYLRLSYATSEENITEAMRRMKEVLARLK